MFAAFSAEYVKQAVLPVEAQPGEISSEDPNPEPKSFMRKALLPAVGVGVGALGIRQLALKAPRYLRHLRGTSKDIGGIGKEMWEASKTPIQSLKKGWKELGAAPGTEKRTNEMADVLRDALEGKKYSLDVIDNSKANLRQMGIGSVGTRYHGRLNVEDVQKSLGNVLYRKSDGQFVLNRNATPDQIEKAYKNLQKMKTRASQGTMEELGDSFSRGISAITRNAPGERIVFPAMTAMGTYGELSQKKDPNTGRERGIAERLGRAGANAFTGLAFNPIFAKQPGLISGLVTQAATDMVASGVAGAAGRGIDTGVRKLRGVNQPTPPAQD
jgi:hypothetical protein